MVVNIFAISSMEYDIVNLSGVEAEMNFIANGLPI